jgi:hypothetical protein
MAARGKPRKPKAGFPPFHLPWKARKAAGFPHSHSLDDGTYYQERISKAVGLTAGPKTVNLEGGPKQTGEVGQKHLPNAPVAAKRSRKIIRL